MMGEASQLADVTAHMQPKHLRDHYFLLMKPI
jgi:hypothetical protein